jgi:hypothetical protein
MQNPLSSSLLSKRIKIKLYRTIISPLVVCGYETWSLTMREECRLRVFENRVLRRIFEPKRDEVTREWRKLHNEELNDLYSPPNFNYNRILVLKEITLKMATRVAETCWDRNVTKVHFVHFVTSL